MADDIRYTAEQLAQAAGVTLRTVRYYVQEGLIDRPDARGPGAHFTDRHLRQIKRCQLLQDWGFDLETIRDKAGSLQPILDGFMVDHSLGLDHRKMRALLQAMSGDPGSTLNAKQAEAVKAVVKRLRGRRTPPRLETKSVTERIPMADGIDLVVDKSRYAIPSPKELVDIALQVRKSFDPLKLRGDDDD